MFRIEVETLYTDEAIAVDRAQKAGTPKELAQPLGLDAAPPEPTQDGNGRAIAIAAVAMRPVRGRVKRFDKRGMLRLYLA